MNKKAVSCYFGGLVIGGAVGLIAGALAAPKSGSKIRSELSETYKGWVLSLWNQSSGWRDNIGAQVQPIAAQAGRYATQLKDRIKPLDGKHLVDNYMGNNSGPVYTVSAQSKSAVK
jgi:gas vesicle protein